MKKLLLITLMIILVLATAVHADGELLIDDAEVNVDGDKDKNADENGGTIEVKPGSNIEIEIKLKNTFERDSDIEINDIEIIGTLFDIDDGDDIEVEIDEFDLDVRDSEKVTLEFEVPLVVEEDMFELLIEIRAEDDNGTDYDIQIDYDVDVEKDRHELVFERLDMAPTTVSCDELVQVDFTIVNIGREDEEETKIEVLASGLDFYFTEDVDFESDPDDSDIKYEKRVDIYTTGVPPGIYEVIVKARYGSSDVLQETKYVSVGPCATDTPSEPEPQDPEPSEPQEPEPQQTTQVVSTPPASDDDIVFQTTAPSVAASPRYITTDSKSDSNDMIWIIVIVITDIVLIVAGVLIYLAFRKKR